MKWKVKQKLLRSPPILREWTTTSHLKSLNYYLSPQIIELLPLTSNHWTQKDHDIRRWKSWSLALNRHNIYISTLNRHNIYISTLNRHNIYISALNRHNIYISALNRHNIYISTLKIRFHSERLTIVKQFWLIGFQCIDMFLFCFIFSFVSLSFSATTHLWWVFNARLGHSRFYSFFHFIDILSIIQVIQFVTLYSYQITGFVRVMESWKSHGFLFCKIKAFKSHGKLYFIEKSLNSHGKLLFEL